MEDVLEQPKLVTMAPGAIAKIKELIAEENNPNLKLRMFVSGGGCSGMQYGFTFEEQGQEDDFVLEFEGIHLLIDSMSSQYLQGAEVDYTESHYKVVSFSIKNPNAQTTCGCGSSFNPG
jgi:iron-sulfur cluster insertion protein